MDPLTAVEDLFGEVDSWPIYHIFNLFVEQPSPTSVKKIAALMYGKGVPFEIAAQCFNTCNGLHRSFVSDAMCDWYSTREHYPHRKHMGQYYFMFFKRWQWINGDALDKQEAVRTEITVMQFGIENTGCVSK